MATKQKTRLIDFPEYAEATGKLAALRVELRDIREEQLPAAERRLAAVRGNDPETIRARARAFLAGEDWEADQASAEEAVRRLHGRVQVLEAAVELQVGEVTRAREACAREIRRAVRAEYLDIVERTAAAVVELQRRVREHGTFVQRMQAEAGGLGGELPEAPAPLFGSDHPESKAAHWLNQLAAVYPSIARAAGGRTA